MPLQLRDQFGFMEETWPDVPAVIRRACVLRCPGLLCAESAVCSQDNEGGEACSAQPTLRKRAALHLSHNQHMGLHFKCMGDKSEQHCTIYNS